jgi:phosphoribosylaminoimidazole-succinocarboxamide synthase
MSETVHVGSGKVRELYALDDERLLLTASDRISVFDVVLPTEIPDKGRVLTGLSGFWFGRTSDVVPNHLLTIREDGRSMECRRLLMLPIECVVRGYLSGSGWTSYEESGKVCGIELPEQATNLVGEERFAELAQISIELYRAAAAYAAEKGIIIADTKFELGLDEQGQIVLGDEAFTPDSSRFWPADEYEPGGPQPSFDKQFVRDYTESLGWDKTPPGPELPEEVVAGTRARYLEAFEQITGIPFDEYAARPQAVLQ